VKEYTCDNIRNIGLVGHGGVGKTSLAESMLFKMGEINRVGKVDNGTTISDYHPDETERKISINTSLLHGEWKDRKINILDTPGYSDFLGDTKSCLAVVDFAVCLVSSVEGIEVGTEQVIEFSNDYDIPRMFFINRLDSEHSNFDNTLDVMKKRYGNGVVAFQFPVNQGEGFNQIVDLLSMKLITYEEGGSGKMSSSEIPEDIKSKAENLKEKIVEAAAESDDELLEIFFDKGELTEEQIKEGLKKGILNKTVLPVFCGVADKVFGVETLLDFIAHYGVVPDDFKTVKGFNPGSEDEIERTISAQEPFSALVFKTISEEHVGEMSLIKVLSGSLKSGMEVANSAQSTSEKIGQIYLLNGKQRKEIGNLQAGDLGALVKLKETSTGDTLCDTKSPIRFKPPEFISPLTSVAIKPQSRGDEDKLSKGLHILHDEDPSFTIVYNPELRQTILSGQGELHLKVILKRLEDRFGVKVVEERPKIPYRETITSKSDDKYRHKKQSGGAGQFAEVWMRIEPLKAGEGFEFENQVKGGAISQPFIPAVEKGVKDVLEEGPLAGYKVVDVKAIVYDGKEHPVDSKEIAFQTAGREVFKKCFLEAKPILLEPIYDIKVKVPEEYMGDVMGDLSGRRGKIGGMDTEGNFQVVNAKVPLAELDKYATSLRSLTSGRGLFSRSFSHYEPVPKEIEKEIIKKSKAEDESEEG